MPTLSSSSSLASSNSLPWLPERSSNSAMSSSNLHSCQRVPAAPRGYPCRPTASESFKTAPNSRGNNRNVATAMAFGCCNCSTATRPPPSCNHKG
ncbi:unnamed protein product [Prunus armeniaca]|uniref:Uncharacterized protein n=1 Tax=Prunus armeniaca TaxID=36596 RepID=A0A6J5VN84_PRUAR|nr:unnamed protein product [Prunus armeniaca]